jgi:hypothetical protein
MGQPAFELICGAVRAHRPQQRREALSEAWERAGSERGLQACDRRAKIARENCSSSPELGFEPRVAFGRAATLGRNKMKFIAKVGCASVLACTLAGPASAAQGDAGSGPTTGATSTNDAGSGPTKGAATAKPAMQNSNSDAAGSTNTAGATPGPSSTGGAQPVTPGGASKQ